LDLYQVPEIQRQQYPPVGNRHFCCRRFYLRHILFIDKADNQVMADSIFTRIIKGEVPCHKVYEDELTFAFMDNHPVQPGHVLVVSKNPAKVVWDLPDEDYHAVWETAHKVANRLREVFPHKKRIAVIVEGLDVPHTHIKIFPIDTGDQLRGEPDHTLWENDEILAEMAKKLAF
jgi:histidine triad (HIT) family protein